MVKTHLKGKSRSGKYFMCISQTGLVTMYKQLSKKNRKITRKVDKVNRIIHKIRKIHNNHGKHVHSHFKSKTAG